MQIIKVRRKSLAKLSYSSSLLLSRNFSDIIALFIPSPIFIGIFCGNRYDNEVGRYSFIRVRKIKNLEYFEKACK